MPPSTTHTFSHTRIHADYFHYAGFIFISPDFALFDEAQNNVWAPLLMLLSIIFFAASPPPITPLRGCLFTPYILRLHATLRLSYCCRFAVSLIAMPLSYYYFIFRYATIMPAFRRHAAAISLRRHARRCCRCFQPSRR